VPAVDFYTKTQSAQRIIHHKNTTLLRTYATYTLINEYPITYPAVPMQCVITEKLKTLVYARNFS